MEKTENRAYNFGLIGKRISYSFSKGYFTKKFKDLALADYGYENYDLEDISDFPKLLTENVNIKGLNVTIPYKELIIPYLDKLHPVAAKIGAVNTIKFTKEGLIGYNTDVYGFEKAISPFINDHHTRALILGTGGASKAVAFVLEALGITYTYVSRKPVKGQLSYEELDKVIIDTHQVLVNCTPLGTFPNIHEKPLIPYRFLSSSHLLFDLIYNPDKTTFLAAGEQQGAAVSNGLAMLEFQAEKSWEIWQL